MKEILQKALGPKYHNIQEYSEGKARKVFLTEWGPGEQKRVIKVDKTELESPTALRNLQKGHNTEKEIDLLAQIQNPSEHNLVPFYDFADLSKFGCAGFASVEEFYESESLEERLCDDPDKEVIKKPLNKKEFQAIFKGVLNAENYLVSTLGVLHRDPNRKNILIGKNAEGEIEARLTDNTNYCSEKDIEAKSLPTMASRSITDPLLAFGELDHYTTQSEIYALTKDMYYSITKQDFVECQPYEEDGENKELILSSTGENLLTQEGKIDIKKHERALKKGIKKLPKWARRYKELFRRGLTLDSKKRFGSMQEFKDKFDRLSKPTIFEKAREHWTKLAAAGLVIATGMGAFGYQMHQRNQREKQKLEEITNSYPVEVDWNGEGLEFSNNLAGVEVRLYQDITGERSRCYPKDSSYLEFKPGERVWGTVNLRDKALPGKTHAPTIEGKIYFEGYEEKDELTLYPLYHDRANDYTDYPGHGLGGMVKLDIPKDITPGIHTIIIEGYAPTREIKDERDEEDKKWDKTNGNRKLFPKFKDPGKVLFQKRIPIFIEGTEKGKYMHFLKLWNSYSDSCGFKKLDDEIGMGYTHKGCVIRLIDPKNGDVKYSSGPKKPYLNLPPPETDGLERVMEVSTRDKKGNIDTFEYINLKGKVHTFENGYTARNWIINLPEKDWQDQTIRYRKRLFESEKERGEVALKD